VLLEVAVVVLAVLQEEAVVVSVDQRVVVVVLAVAVAVVVPRVVVVAVEAVAVVAVVLKVAVEEPRVDPRSLLNHTDTKVFSLVEVRKIYYLPRILFQEKVFMVKKEFQLIMLMVPRLNIVSGIHSDLSLLLVF